MDNDKSNLHDDFEVTELEDQDLEGVAGGDLEGNSNCGCNNSNCGCPEDPVQGFGTTVGTKQT